jgi:hypothetical protein
MISNGHAVKSEARLSSSYPHRGKRFKDGGRMALKIGDASWAYALIEEIRLVPENGKLKIELYGELAALLNLANEHPRSKGTGVQITLVAGTRSHLYRTRFQYKRKARE